ncbi:MAG: PaaX domain-containing protein, C- domain protein [Ilumatobacteraceae bacterium]
MAVGDQGIRPFNARSLVLSVLLGLEPPVLPVRALVTVGELFGVAPGTMRTALSRMVAAGELSVGDDGYRLQGRLLARKAAQDIGRRPSPSRWDGTWWVAVVSVPRRSVADRRAFRTEMANARMGELRADTWLRPANLDGPVGDDSLVVVRGPLTGADPAQLAGRLWSLEELAHTATRIGDALERAEPGLADGRPDALPAAITLAAEVVRFLRAEPLLPVELLPSPWAPDELRQRYRTFDRLLGRTLINAVH